MTPIVERLANYASRVGGKLEFLRNNPLPLIIWPAGALSLALVGWGLLLDHNQSERQLAEKSALREAAASAQSYANHVAWAVATVDQILLHVKFDWAISKGNLQLEDTNQLGLFPPSAFFNVAVIDRDGRISTSAIPNTRGRSVGDKAYFLKQKEAVKDELFIGKPTYSDVSHRFVIPFSRRLTSQSGNFAGAVVAAVVPEYFTLSYGFTFLGKNGFLGVLGADNILRVPYNENREELSDSAILIDTPSFVSNWGSVLLKGDRFFADKHSRYLGWAAVRRYPLIALSGLDQQETLAPYWTSHFALIRTGAWGTSILAILTLAAMFFSARLSLRKYQLELTQATYRIATEVGKEGFYIVRPVPNVAGGASDFEFIDCNHRGAEFLRQRRDELIGKRVSALYEGANTNRLITMLQRALRSGSYASDLELPSESPVVLRWVHLTIVRSQNNLAVTLRDISEIKAHVLELERRSNEDTLTGLPNRHWMQAYLPKAVKHSAEQNTMLAILFIDLDGFKAVNDTAGHEAGDEVLRNAARRIKDAVRPHDHVARLGGDEFVVILEQIVHQSDAEHVADRIQRAFQQRFRLSTGVYSVGTSIGISLYPTHGLDANALLRHADIAMYSVKSSGKGSYQFYDQKLYEEQRIREEQETELRNAIKKNQFIVYYQPRIDVVTGITVGMEALVRWEHPSKGLLEPKEFLRLAEETGLILEIGKLVFDKVAQQLQYWSLEGQELVPVSINVSSRQCTETDIAEILTSALAQHGVELGLVEIELAESLMLGANPDVTPAVTSIRRMGVKLLVDNFGTSYSSLPQLQQLDFGVLKVDGALTRELGRSKRANTFYKAIIIMAHALGMRVVAEGVENEIQFNALKELGCDEIQGFFISKPLPPGSSQPILPKKFLPSLPSSKKS